MTLAGEAKTGLVLTDAMRLDWLRLIRSENIGPRTFKTLINHYGGAGAALEALPGLVRSKQGRDIRICSRADAEREWEQATRMGVRFVAIGEADYPVPLRNIADPPPLLSVRGDVSMLSRHCIAIVGSRNASIAGIKMTERLAIGLGQAGIIVVSGLARGIDVAAHKASLKSGTIAVLAGGHAKLYPADHAPLLDQILAEGGAALSEMPLAWEPRARDFPRRNRLVSGLALGVVVVEAAKRSGSLITARFAGEQGRELFAVPGSPMDPRAEGTNDLIRDGATLTGSVDHILSVITPMIEKGPLLPLFGQEQDEDDARASYDDEPLWDELDLGDFQEPGRAYQSQAASRHEATAQTHARLAKEEPRERAQSGHERVLTLMTTAPVGIDDLAREAGVPVREVQQIVLMLEIEGRLQRHGNNLVSIL